MTLSKIPPPFRKRYQIIVVDPPWPVKKVTHRARPNQIKMDYSTMSVIDISKLPIEKIADNPSWCFLWTTQKFLFGSKSILEGWGFNHLLTMGWKKTYGRSSGMPLFGFRWNLEFILVGHKGKIPMWPKRKLIQTAFAAENKGHSVKPDMFYESIEILGNNRIDLFARKQRKGWDVWGNEVESDIIL